MKRTNIAIDDALAIGTDHEFAFHIKNKAETESRDITGWGLSFMVKRRLSDSDAHSVVTKSTTAGGIVFEGVFDSDPDVNTQLAVVSVSDDDTDGVTPGLCYYELKRTDAGFEELLAQGNLTLSQAVHRS